jgi:hypothetical protein
MPATSEPLGASSRSVSRLRQQGKHDATPDNDSTASLASRTSSVGDDNADMRSSMDTAIDKVRERRVGLCQPPIQPARARRQEAEAQREEQRQ